MEEKIVIRNLQTVAELEQVRELEALIWSFEDSIPINQTVAAVKNGGFILGAFLHHELIGFQYSFPGFDGSRAYLCSHSLGIHPDYRKFGIGERLKLAQKETALLKGYDLITWTYDPLETVNGNLNLHKLGAICTGYMEDVYGEMNDRLNKGIPTDRFLVEWRIKHEKNSKVLLEEIPYALRTAFTTNYQLPEDFDLTLKTDLLYVPVPGNYQEMKQEDFELAQKWRMATRKIFNHYLSNGWIVTDLIKDDENQNRYLYLLEKGKGAY